MLSPGRRAAEMLSLTESRRLLTRLPPARGRSGDDPMPAPTRRPISPCAGICHVLFVKRRDDLQAAGPKMANVSLTCEDGWGLSKMADCGSTTPQSSRGQSTDAHR